MSLTQDEQVIGESGKVLAEKISYEGIQINTANPFSQTDYGTIIKAFEIECAEWAEEDYALAYHYRDVYGTEHFSQRVREQMDYYPGMHQNTTNVSAEDPQYTNAKEKSEDRLNFFRDVKYSELYSGITYEKYDLYDWLITNTLFRKYNEKGCILNYHFDDIREKSKKIREKKIVRFLSIQRSLKTTLFQRCNHSHRTLIAFYTQERLALNSIGLYFYLAPHEFCVDAHFRILGINQFFFEAFLHTKY